MFTDVTSLLARDAAVSTELDLRPRKQVCCGFSCQMGCKGIASHVCERGRDICLLHQPLLSEPFNTTWRLKFARQLKVVRISGLLHLQWSKQILIYFYLTSLLLKPVGYKSSALSRYEGCFLNHWASSNPVQ